jgi:diadenylate cyclase
MGSLPIALDALQPKDLVEIGILFVAIYLVLRFLRRTIAGGIFRGPATLSWVVILGFFLVLRALKLDVVSTILTQAIPVFLMALVVVFQPELRHGIARLGETRLFRGLLSRRAQKPREIRAVDEILRAVTTFAEKRTGALIAIERTIDLGTYIETGVPMDSLVRAETLDTIFSTETLLHDGAVVLRGDRIAAAGCLLPLTERPQLARRYGTRHRAAIGLSEQSDAVVVVVSEETGQIHVAERGELKRYDDPAWLGTYLNVVMAERTGLLPPEPGRSMA